MLGAKLRLVVVFGGVSSEHSVSCLTAGEVLKNIDTNKYEILPVGITKSGVWVVLFENFVDVDLEKLLVEVSENGAGSSLFFRQGKAFVVDNSFSSGSVVKELGKVDVVLPLLHGPFGEDGTLQGLLELEGVSYVGSGVLASALCMDKHFMKLFLASLDFYVTPYVLLFASSWVGRKSFFEKEVEELGFPVFVKPVRSGSSLGVSKVMCLEDLEAAVLLAFEYDPKVIVEAFVVGREIECAVLQARVGGDVRVSVPGEIVVTGGESVLYDFEAKYVSQQAVRVLCPAPLEDEVVLQVQKLAGEVFVGFGCEGLARVDFFYTVSGDFVVNEVNTMPGFTPVSMFPRLWLESGFSYRDLVGELLELALEKKVGLR